MLQDALRNAMRKAAASVSVVSTRHDGRRMAMTATSFCSVSLNPPSILLCVNRAASMHGALRDGARFCLNLLAEDQQALSAACGGHVPPEDRFEVGGWKEEAGGLPYVSDAQANLFCTVERLVDHGTHTIVIASVNEVKAREHGAPLVYLDGRYLEVGLARV